MCNALLAGPPEVLQIQRVINCSAGLICKALSTAYINHSFGFRSPLATNQQPSSIKKIALICFHHTSPSCFISTLFLALFAQSRIFRGPRMGRRTLGDRSFQRIGPVIWNSLPLWQAFVFTLSSKLQLKPTSSLLHTDLVVAFFLFILSAQHY